MLPAAALLFIIELCGCSLGLPGTTSQLKGMAARTSPKLSLVLATNPADSISLSHSLAADQSMLNSPRALALELFSLTTHKQTTYLYMTLNLLHLFLSLQMGPGSSYSSSSSRMDQLKLAPVELS
jgi:hypothetical protein